MTESAAKPRERFYGLLPAEYEHPFDRKALNALEEIPALPSITKKLVELSFEKIFRIQFSGSNLCVTRQNMPDVHSLLLEACAILDIRKIPDLFIRWDYSVNAFTTGVEDPFIVLNSGCIDLLSNDELLFVLGHELGHIKSGHVLYRTMAEFLPAVVDLLGQVTLGIAGVAGTGMQLALMNWYRMSEFTADRAGLLTCQSSDVCINSMLKLAGLPQKYDQANFKQSFLQQAREFEDLDYSTINRTVKLFSTLTTSHPWTVLRASQFLVWINSGEYEDLLLAYKSKTIETPKGSQFCANCGAPLALLSQRFCGSCGSVVNSTKPTSLD